MQVDDKADLCHVHRCCSCCDYDSYYDGTYSRWIRIFILSPSGKPIFSRRYCNPKYYYIHNNYRNCSKDQNNDDLINRNCNQQQPDIKVKTSKTINNHNSPYDRNSSGETFSKESKLSNTLHDGKVLDMSFKDENNSKIDYPNDNNSSCNNTGSKIKNSTDGDVRLREELYHDDTIDVARICAMIQAIRTNLSYNQQTVFGDLEVLRASSNHATMNIVFKTIGSLTLVAIEETITQPKGRQQEGTKQLQKIDKNKEYHDYDYHNINDMKQSKHQSKDDVFNTKTSDVYLQLVLEYIYSQIVFNMTEYGLEYNYSTNSHFDLQSVLTNVPIIQSLVDQQLYSILLLHPFVVTQQQNLQMQQQQRTLLSLAMQSSSSCTVPRSLSTDGIVNSHISTIENDSCWNCCWNCDCCPSIGITKVCNNSFWMGSIHVAFPLTYTIRHAASQALRRQISTSTATISMENHPLMSSTGNGPSGLFFAILYIATSTTATNSLTHCDGHNEPINSITTANRLITMVQPSHYVHQMRVTDLQILMEFVSKQHDNNHSNSNECSSSQSSPSSAELWLPVCLPRFNSSAFMHCYTQCLSSFYSHSHESKNTCPHHLQNQLHKLVLALVSPIGTTEEFQSLRQAAFNIRRSLRIPTSADTVINVASLSPPTAPAKTITRETPQTFDMTYPVTTTLPLTKTSSAYPLKNKDNSCSISIDKNYQNYCNKNENGITSLEKDYRNYNDATTTKNEIDDNCNNSHERYHKKTEVSKNNDDETHDSTSIDIKADKELSIQHSKNGNEMNNSNSNTSDSCNDNTNGLKQSTMTTTCLSKVQPQHQQDQQTTFTLTSLHDGVKSCIDNNYNDIDDDDYVHIPSLSSLTNTTIATNTSHGQQPLRTSTSLVSNHPPISLSRVSPPAVVCTLIEELKRAYCEPSNANRELILDYLKGAVGVHHFVFRYDVEILNDNSSRQTKLRNNDSNKINSARSINKQRSSTSTNSSFFSHLSSQSYTPSVVIDDGYENGFLSQCIWSPYVPFNFSSNQRQKVVLNQKNDSNKKINNISPSNRMVRHNIVRMWSMYQKLSLRLRLSGSTSSESINNAYRDIHMTAQSSDIHSGRQRVYDERRGSSSILDGFEPLPTTATIGQNCPAMALLERPPQSFYDTNKTNNVTKYKPTSIIMGGDGSDGGVTYVLQGDCIYLGMTGNGYELYLTASSSVPVKEVTSLGSKLIRRIMNDEKVLFVSNPLSWNSD